MSKATKSWKDKSAIIQVNEKDLPSSTPPQTGLTFNVWYNKWSQGNTGNRRFVNKYRLEPSSHSGITLGDKSSNVFFCLYFAKGMCSLGKKCQYKHHIPEDSDSIALLMKSDILDCFGREKFADYRDDMSGIGSFRKKNRTLYIGGITGAINNKELKPSQIESRLRYMFSRLGLLDRLRYLENKNCAFIKFKNQCNAEFAKEVMSNQTLLIPSDKEWDERNEGTGLLVKWANDDPDTAAQKREREEQAKTALNAMINVINKEQDNDTVLKKRRLELQDSKSSFGPIFDDIVLEKVRAKFRRSSEFKS
ncbi:hypothetical protein TBLA_0D02810 [Henningerozyma blattae CBS 6284]|uniref:Pre-mRNA-splicing factor CWC2 n=1 Tax=Henningerozyma blattae (strain ATCC 34711 / CBS 6284 / DSM 70876 / NBRC 10599 / NRRL Y-10934 / UCD 77-7) TaxID=1071380 RepID=I2H330_HENB6|nr:hypothetical protein TBLA_0D02810 [Tetrapisispora blattae CBS 6284]CCH60782.1 hypothetical protein TBLA_0D02810 [Tetrapisispora blattae CBS 6284]